MSLLCRRVIHVLSLLLCHTDQLIAAILDGDSQGIKSVVSRTNIPLCFSCALHFNSRVISIIIALPLTLFLSPPHHSPPFPSPFSSLPLTLLLPPPHSPPPSHLR